MENENKKSILEWDKFMVFFSINKKFLFEMRIDSKFAERRREN